MFENKKSQGIFSSLPPKTSFILGAVVGFLVVCAIGFFVLLGVFISNKEEGESQVVNQNSNVNQPAPTGSLASSLKKITKSDHVRGDLNAKVMMVEFSDFQCPFCQRVHPTLQQLVDDYDGEVAWAYKHFPLDSLHPFARKAAEASECAAEQGKFWDYADGLYNNQSLINEDYLPQLASQLSLNTSKFNDCLSSGKYAGKVNEHYQEGQSVGITGTPGIYVNDQLVKGAYPYENFKQIIDSMLK